MSLVQPLVQTPVPALDSAPIGGTTYVAPVFGDAVFGHSLTPGGRGAATLSLVAVERGGRPVLPGRGSGLARLSAIGRGHALGRGRGAAQANLQATGRGIAVLAGRGDVRLLATAVGRGGAVLRGQGTGLARVTATGRGFDLHFFGRSRLSLVATGRGYVVGTGKGKPSVKLQATGRGAALLSGRGAGLGRLLASGRGNLIARGIGRPRVELTARGLGKPILQGRGLANAALLSDHLKNRARHYGRPSTSLLRAPQVGTSGLDVRYGLATFPADLRAAVAAVTLDAVATAALSAREATALLTPYVEPLPPPPPPNQAPVEEFEEVFV